MALNRIETRWTSFFLRFKFAVFRYGYVKLEIEDGGKWKIDCEGFLLEDGKGMCASSCEQDCRLTIDSY